MKGRDPTGLETSTSLNVRTGSSLITEIGHPSEMLFKGNIPISRGHSLLRCLIVPVLLHCLLFVNKMCKSIWEKKSSSYVFLHATEVSEVTQESTVPV